MIRKGYNSFITNTENSIKNYPKRFWSFVKAKRGETGVQCTKDSDGGILTSPQAIDSAFAVYGDSHHMDTLDDGSSKACACPALLTGDSCGRDFVMHGFRVYDDNILKAAKRLRCNCVAGPDGVLAFVVVDFINSFLLPLSHIFN